MGLPELVARINQNGANAAIVISLWRGNPGDMTIISSKGEEIINIRLESALLRREVNPTGPSRISRADCLLFKTGSSPSVKALAENIASLLNIEISEQENPNEVPMDKAQSFIWLEDGNSGKILWTHYSSINRTEIGPRIRISAVRGNITE